MADSAPEMVEHWFRHEAGRLVASLGRRLGAANLDLAEDAVQDALVLALRQWPYSGTPANASAWLAQAARHRALDRLRRRAAFDRSREILAALVPQVAVDAELDEQLDDQLAMMFACCHPSLPEDSRVPLTLKIVCGFSTAEIGRAFLADPATIAQRLVRAKRSLRDSGVAISIPPSDELPERLDSVLQVLYLLFNEGYAAHQGGDLVRHDFCAEALRLGMLLTDRADTALPKTHALVALMCFQSSRLPARVDGAGELLRLADQDRSLWDQRFIFGGLRHLDQASEGDEISPYHIEAGIAGLHAQAPDDTATNWPQILRLYDALIAHRPTPIVALNRAVAVAKVRGPQAGLQSLADLDGVLGRYYLLHAVRADQHRQIGNFAEARSEYERALACPCSEPERRFLQAQLAVIDPNVKPE
jgi:RNA polymerase sigma-70 factor, ECF subfamily